MTILRRLFLATCLLTFAGSTIAACGGSSKKAMAPAADSVTEPETDDACAPAMDKDGDADQDLTGRDPCDPPIPE